MTGAARRLGRALALAAAESGYDVIVHARSSSDAAETVDLARALGVKAMSCAGDLEDVDVPGTLISGGPGPITLLVNCASLFEADEIGTLNAESLNRAWAVNLRTPVLLSQAFAAALPADRRGLIVNILDQRIWRLNPLFFSYTLTKASLWAATQTLAQALAPRIRVNAIGPGPTLASVHQDAQIFAAEAAATPLGMPASPREIGQALRYLIDAPSVTGQMIAVDAGQHLAWRTPDVVAGLPG